MHARAPEREAIMTHDAPVVERIAPELARLGEVIRRHTGHGRRAPFAVELELFGVRPGFRRIRRHVERQIAEQPHATRVRVARAAAPIATRRRTARFFMRSMSEASSARMRAIAAGSRSRCSAGHIHHGSPRCEALSASNSDVILEPASRSFEERAVFAAVVRTAARSDRATRRCPRSPSAPSTASHPCQWARAAGTARR